ncbi:aldo/keto reductase [Pedobacter punctiformis]|uniref:aldo/keto reductase n=1 Tax=Pedobacter punctiformis TaxID=3004097 RepID=UPI003D17236A
MNTTTSLTENKKATVAQLVLKWTTLQKGVRIVLTGAKDKEQAIANAGAMNFDLTANELLSLIYF